MKEGEDAVEKNARVGVLFAAWRASCCVKGITKQVLSYVSIFGMWTSATQPSLVGYIFCAWGLMSFNLKQQLQGFASRLSFQ